MAAEKIPYKEKKAEAVTRMEAIGIFPEVIKQFKDHGLVNQSEPPFGACFWINDELKARVRRFEAKHNALVYHVIKTNYVELGTMYSYFYICDERDEWQMDRDDLKAGIAFVWVDVEEDPTSSEFGNIAFKLSPAAGLLRTQ